METEMDWAVAFDDFSADVTLAAGTVTASEESTDQFNTVFLF